MKIEFYTFDKKYNSTKQPTLKSGTEFECYLKTSSSIVSPTIELNIGLAVNPSAYNYAYISDYGRYYWVSEWTFANSSWFASLNVDVLASWKTYIGDTSMYVYRSSAEKNGSIVDLKYPTTTAITTTVEGQTGSTTTHDFTTGSYIIGIYGDNAGNGSISYYGFTPTNYASFINQLFINVLGNNSIWNEIGEGIRNAVFDISAYIKSCRWYPIDISMFDTTKYPPTSSITMGSIPIACTARYMGGGSCLEMTVPRLMNAFIINKHPQASSRGSYCNLKPYTLNKLVALPFGIFDLDGSRLSPKSYLLPRVLVDIITGMGVLTVKAGSDIVDRNDDLYVMTATCQYGVDIPISTSSLNLGGIVEMGAGLINGFLGNTIGAFAGFVKGATDFLSPEVNTVSNKGGGMAYFNYNFNGFYQTFYDIANDNNAINGRPLFATRQPKNISGYIEGDSDNFSCPATDSEQTEIRRFIDNGFYYE